MVSYYHRAQFCLLKWWPGWPKFKSGGQSNSEILDNFLSYDSILVIAILKVIFALLSYFWCWPPKFKSDFEACIIVFTCVAEGRSRSRNRFLRPSVPARQYLLSVICNSNSFQSILFKLCTVFVYILKMCPSYYGLIWRFFSYIFCKPNLVIFYHYMSWTVPSWYNLKLQQYSINIIQTLHSVCIHIEDVHLLLWDDLTIFFFNFLYVELSHFLSLYDIDDT